MPPDAHILAVLSLPKRRNGKLTWCVSDAGAALTTANATRTRRTPEAVMGQPAVLRSMQGSSGHRPPPAAPEQTWRALNLQDFGCSRIARSNEWQL